MAPRPRPLDGHPSAAEGRVRVVCDGRGTWALMRRRKTAGTGSRLAVRFDLWRRLAASSSHGIAGDSSGLFELTIAPVPIPACSTCDIDRSARDTRCARRNRRHQTVCAACGGP